MSKLVKLLGYIKKYKYPVFLNIICNVLLSIFTIATIPAIIPFLQILFKQTPKIETPVALKANFSNIIEFIQWKFSDLINTLGQEKAVWLACGSIIVLFFLSNLFRYLAMYVISPVRVGIIGDIRESLFHKIMRLPLSYFSEEKKGDLMSRITADVQEIEWSILNVLEAIFREPIMIIGSLAYMLYVSPSLTMFAFAMILIIGLVVAAISKTLRKQSGEAQRRLGGVTSVIEESLGGLRIIKAFNAENHQQAKFDTENNAFKRTMISILRRRDLASPMSEWLGVTIVSLLIIYGSNLVFKGEMIASSFLAFLFAFFRAIDPAKSLSNAWSNIQKGFAAMDRIDFILAADESIQDEPNAREVNDFKEKLSFNNVSFNYKNAETQVLQNITFELNKGKSIALVGASGSGKSTLLDMIPRFQDPIKGSIELDGTDIKHIKIADLRNLMGIVTQDAILFNDTIFNNIVFGETEVTEAEVIAAAKTANAHEFIKEMEGGYQANVGDRGSKLSGGQRQRITIARAVLKNPPILLLDEATSALDSESEKLVQQALNVLMQNRTSLIIAHRLSTIMEADEIFVMNKGKIIERGNHQSLLELKGEYYSLVKLQSF